MGRAHTRTRRRNGDAMTWKERWTVFKHNRRKPGLVTNDTKIDNEPLFEANSLVTVLITIMGRMANVVGTMKMYKGLGKFFSDRKRKKFRKATERVQNGETEVEFTELFTECCMF
nr:Protein F20D12.7 [Haemonchus contortus]